MENALTAETKPEGFSKACVQETEIIRKKDRLRTRRSFGDLGIPLPYSEILKIFSSVLIGYLRQHFLSPTVQ